ncbi:MAG: 2-oxo-4-hydroxy-4-carboxy-5-ureidoimidazoline decarboxylase [Chloroflexi bacterium]|nr:2-oxo-4-hydroxy-4-carboxy-5-ureidoimidazoline decarboxylase [Chloroflexota bacterium]
MDLDTLNTLPSGQFLEAIGGPLEGETWLAARVVQRRPFADRDALIAAFADAIGAASADEKIRLLESHPELAVKVDRELSSASQREQASAGLDRLTPDEHDEFKLQNQAYRARFGFPFVICARENTKHSILAAFRQRLTHTREAEIENGAHEVFKILRLRLIDLIS